MVTNGEDAQIFLADVATQIDSSLRPRTAAMTDEASGDPADAARVPDDDDGPSDRSLLRQYRHGDQTAASLLYERYAKRLRMLARRLKSPALNARVDDDEIVQSVFGSFFRKVNNGAYDVPYGEELWNLFCRIALNKVRAKGAYHRAAKRDIRQTVGDEGIDQVPDELSSDSQAREVLRLSIEEALQHLSENYRSVIRLRMDGLEVGEIAESIRRSKRTVERLLQEARDELASRLGLNG